jgi:pimeloyl-ACP methyl ester carboxylesterase
MSKERDMSKIKLLLFGLCLACLLSGFVALGKSQFDPFDKARINEDGTFTIINPRGTIVILYTPGSERNDVVGYCRPMAGAPAIILHQAGTEIAGKAVLVHGYCSKATGELPERSMSEARAPDLERIVKEYVRQGVPANQIFVAGHSMGGWAALLVGARKNVEIGGFIAFAPANGVWTKEKRGPNHKGVVARQKTSVEGLDRLDGLVFTFYGDQFNSPSDLEHLAEIPGIEFVASEPCSNDAHSSALYDCFWKQFEDKVRAFIETRVLITGD